MFNSKKNTKGEVLLIINFNLLDFLTKFFVTLNKIFSAKAFYLIPIGLGIGFGIGVVVFSQPPRIGAQETINQVAGQAIVPHRITIKQLNFTSLIEKQTNFSLLPLNWQNDLIYFSNFHSGQNNPTLIAVKNSIIKNLKLGDKITIEGENNGQYQYSVTQTKQVPAKDFYRALEATTPKIIIISPQNLIGTQLLLAFAK